MKIKELPVYFPNSFRPSSALSENQFFKPKTTLDNIVAYRMLIYNKWGQEIFESEDIQKGWDGKYDGEAAPAGVYVYHVTYRLEGNVSKDGEDFELKGTVVLVD
ncbi:MAG: gliding motility-associated C-terminal domain-containing protein, partial [Bacteroidales bacterium]